MSQENVEIVRRAWEARVSQGPEAVLDFFTEDCVLEDFPIFRIMPSTSAGRACL